MNLYSGFPICHHPNYLIKIGELFTLPERLYGVIIFGGNDEKEHTTYSNYIDFLPKRLRGTAFESESRLEWNRLDFR